MQVVAKAKQRPGLVIAVAVAIAVVLGFGVFWFGPQKLFLNETASDVPPGAQADNAGDVTTLSEGSFTSLAHETTGTARIVEVDGATYLRFDGLDSLNGPDLVVYLSSQASTDDPAAFDDTLVVDLGVLEANRGDLNIEIPAGSDLSEVRSAVIWCRRFTVAFGAADLTPIT